MSSLPSSSPFPLTTTTTTTQKNKNIKQPVSLPPPPPNKYPGRGKKNPSNNKYSYPSHQSPKSSSIYDTLTRSQRIAAKYDVYIYPSNYSSTTDSGTTSSYKNTKKPMDKLYTRAPSVILGGPYAFDWSQIFAIGIHDHHSKYTCPLCLESPQYRAPHILPCGHVYCWCCWLRYIDQSSSTSSILSVTSSYSVTCPICNEWCLALDIRPVHFIPVSTTTVFIPSSSTSSSSTVSKITKYQIQGEQISINQQILSSTVPKNNTMMMGTMDDEIHISSLPVVLPSSSSSLTFLPLQPSSSSTSSSSSSLSSWTPNVASESEYLTVPSSIIHEPNPTKYTSLLRKHSNVHSFPSSSSVSSNPIPFVTLLEQERDKVLSPPYWGIFRLIQVHMNNEYDNNEITEDTTNSSNVPSSSSSLPVDISLHTIPSMEEETSRYTRTKICTPAFMMQTWENVLKDLKHVEELYTKEEEEITNDVNQVITASLTDSSTILMTSSSRSGSSSPVFNPSVKSSPTVHIDDLPLNPRTTANSAWGNRKGVKQLVSTLQTATVTSTLSGTPSSVSSTIIKDQITGAIVNTTTNSNNPSIEWKTIAINYGLSMHDVERINQYSDLLHQNEKYKQFVKYARIRTETELKDYVLRNATDKGVSTNVNRTSSNSSNTSPSGYENISSSASTVSTLSLSYNNDENAPVYMYQSIFGELYYVHPMYIAALLETGKQQQQQHLQQSKGLGIGKEETTGGIESLPSSSTTTATVSSSTNESVLLYPEWSWERSRNNFQPVLPPLIVAPINAVTNYITSHSFLKQYPGLKYIPYGNTVSFVEINTKHILGLKSLPSELRYSSAVPKANHSTATVSPWEWFYIRIPKLSLIITGVLDELMVMNLQRNRALQEFFQRQEKGMNITSSTKKNKKATNSKQSNDTVVVESSTVTHQDTLTSTTIPSDVSNLSVNQSSPLLDEDTTTKNYEISPIIITTTDDTNDKVSSTFTSTETKPTKTTKSSSSKAVKTKIKSQEELYREYMGITSNVTETMYPDMSSFSLDLSKLHDTTHFPELISRNNSNSTSSTTVSPILRSSNSTMFTNGGYPLLPIQDPFLLSSATSSYSTPTTTTTTNTATVPISSTVTSSSAAWNFAKIANKGGYFPTLSESMQSTASVKTTGNTKSTNPWGSTLPLTTSTTTSSSTPMVRTAVQSGNNNNDSNMTVSSVNKHNPPSALMNTLAAAEQSSPTEHHHLDFEQYLQTSMVSKKGKKKGY